jgi:hypothetical protein
MKEGLTLAVQLGCSTIIAESDSMDIIEACTGDRILFDESLAVFVDCVDLVLEICPRGNNKLVIVIS